MYTLGNSMQNFHHSAQTNVQQTVSSVPKQLSLFPTEPVISVLHNTHKNEICMKKSFTLHVNQNGFLCGQLLKLSLNSCVSQSENSPRKILIICVYHMNLVSLKNQIQKLRALEAACFCLSPQSCLYYSFIVWLELQYFVKISLYIGLQALVNK